MSFTGVAQRTVSVVSSELATTSTSFNAGLHIMPQNLALVDNNYLQLTSLWKQRVEFLKIPGGHRRGIQLHPRSVC